MRLWFFRLLAMSDIQSRESSPISAYLAVPPGAPPWVTAELIEHTIRVWQPYYANRLTPHDALAMILNVGTLVQAIIAEERP